MHATLADGGWLGLMCALTVVGGGWGALLVLPLFASPRTRPFASSLGAVLAATAAVVFVLKAIVKRPRPYLTVPGVQARVFEPPGDFSFPSGHAAGSFAFAAFVAVVLAAVAVREPKYGRAASALSLVLLAAACGVAASRCALGVHFPADVVAGAALGAALGVLGARVHVKRRAR